MTRKKKLYAQRPIGEDIPMKSAVRLAPRERS
jgi:hypothetical protein